MTNQIMTDDKVTISRVQRHLTCPQVTMVIDKQGSIIECQITESIGKIIDLSELTYIAKLVSLRYDVAQFHAILDGLQMTINIFKHVLTLTTFLNDGKLLIVIVPKNVNLFDLINAGEDVIGIEAFPPNRLAEK